MSVSGDLGSVGWTRWWIRRARRRYPKQTKRNRPLPLRSSGCTVTVAFMDRGSGPAESEKAWEGRQGVARESGGDRPQDRLGVRSEGRQNCRAGLLGDWIQGDHGSVPALHWYCTCYRIASTLVLQ